MTKEVETKKLDYKSLWLINEVLPFLNDAGLNACEQNYEGFLDVVRQKNQKADVTWTELVKAFEFRNEAQKINAYLADTEGVTD